MARRPHIFSGPVSHRPTFVPPKCKQCGHNRNVVKHSNDQWLCTVHLKVGNVHPKSKVQLPPGVRSIEPDTPIVYRDLFPNRRARRRAKITQRS